MNNTINASDCSNLNTVQFKIVFALRASTSGLSLICSLVCITIIFLFKKYAFRTQRLILYLCIAVAVNSVSRLVNISPRIYNSEGEPAAETFCSFGGFTDQYTLCTVVLAVTVITIDVFLRGVSNKETGKLELVYVMITFVMPMLFVWLPFINNTYGDAGAWCWIKATDEMCQNIVYGVVLRLVLLYVPLFLLMSLQILLLAITVCILYRNRYNYEVKVDPYTFEKRKSTRKEVKQLIWYPVIFIILYVLPVANRIYSIFHPGQNVFWLLAVTAVSAPLFGCFITLAYVLDKDTRKRLTFLQIKGAIKERFCCADKMLQVYPAVVSNRTDSFVNSIDITLTTEYALDE